MESAAEEHTFPFFFSPVLLKWRGRRCDKSWELKCENGFNSDKNNNDIDATFDRRIHITHTHTM